MLHVDLGPLQPEVEQWAESHPEGVAALLESLLNQAFQSEHGGRITALASEETLGRIWNTPEEDDAWQDL